MNEYLGIPYAAPPVGPLRWTPPLPHDNWQGLLQTTQFGNKCPQFDVITNETEGDEDCLFLNVYTQIQGNPGSPVIVWIHGGGLVGGSGDPYDPTRLVAKGVIVVTVNYRIGLLGFFAHPAIDHEGHLNGNYGLMDQQLALKWVKRNIAAFGGDPSRVTIFGESAGGHSVYAQLASPLAAGLFQSAIAESGAYSQFQDYFHFVISLAAAETTGVKPFVPSGIAVAATVGCRSDNSAATAACLRGVPAGVFANWGLSGLYAIIDGKLLTQSPTRALARGRFNRVPVMSGSNRDEWRFFVAIQYDFNHMPIRTKADYDQATIDLFGVSLESTYPYASYPSGGVALGASGTDNIFACPERKSVRLLSKFVKTYAYEFDDENAPPLQSDPLFGGILSFPLGAYHAAELQFLFIGDFFGFPVRPLSADEQALSDAMVNYWTSFGKTGNPNSPSTPFWAPYKSSTDNFQSLTTPTPGAESTFNAKHLCSAVWDIF